MAKKSQFITGSTNVFADLGLEDAGELLAKATLARSIAGLIKKRGLTQQKAAALLGTSQAKISDVVRGRLDAFTLDRLMKMLVAFDQDVSITCKPKPVSRTHGMLSVHAP